MELEQQFLIMGVMGGEQVLRRMLIIDKHDAGAPVMAGIWNGTNGDTEVLKKYRRAMIADLTDEPPWIVKESWHRLQPEIKHSICSAMKNHAKEICNHMHLGEAVQ
jgi:hypothetical protein